MPKIVRSVSPLLAGTLLLLAACGGDGGNAAAGGEQPKGADGAAAPAAGGEAAAPAAPATPADNGPTADLAPNELGEIMVLEYHRLGNNEGEFIRRADNFRKDLQSLYEKGYRPVTMRQVIEGNIDVPAGTTPVVFTIDDSSLGQFYYTAGGQIDPNTMMGMWASFKERNPGWRNGAVWCVLPAADYPSNFFGEKKSREVPRAEREATIKKKVDYLVRNNHEICNHTLYHARLDRARDDAQAQEWIGRGEDSIKVYLPPDYDIVTFALPLGMWPRNRATAWQGSWNGKPYRNEVVLEVSGGPNVSPWDVKYDPHSVDRFIVAPGALERQLAAYEKNPARRYVSDGDPNTVAYPQREAARLDRNRLRGKTAKVVPDQPAGGAPAGGAAQPAPAAQAGGGGR